MSACGDAGWAGRKESYRLGHGRVSTVLAAIVEVDLPGFRDGVGLVVIHQLVQRGESLRPQVVLAAAVPHHFEVLNITLMSVKGRKKKHIENLTTPTVSFIPEIQRFAQLDCPLLAAVQNYNIKPHQKRITSLVVRNTKNDPATLKEESNITSKLYSNIALYVFFRCWCGGVYSRAAIMTQLIGEESQSRSNTCGKEELY